ncbi:MAG: radical SAM protein, partial [Cyclobacteriaceae bacterium]|nr:radical SAM protein [Cyclobacteriaceae bacterium]
YLVSELLKNNKEIPDISLEGHPNNTTEEHLEVMYRLGARRVSFGIQDFDPRVQELIHRIQPFDKVKEVTETARRIGYTSVNYDLIYGLPAQTLQTVTDTLDKTLSLKPDRIAFYSYAHVPWMKPAQKSFEAHLPNGEEKRTLYEWGKQHFMDAGYKEIGMDHFALPTDSLYLAHESGGLHRNFMGYTTQTTRYMIGLGASSISDLWTAFAQNEKSVEAYMARVNAGEFPIEKGHLLSSDDLMVRAHILDLMCRFRTDFTYNPALLADLKDRLVEMENDGLVEWRANTLAVLPKGEPFIRNVCMSLDLRLLSSRPSTQLFSQTV